MKKKASITALCLAAFLLVCFGAGTIAMQCAKLRPDRPLILESVRINGATQWITLTEETPNDSKPVLLFLHGGPGSANLNLLKQQCPGLDRYAIIVNWDQRGAGKSFSLFSSPNALSLEQNLADAHTLTQYLKERFQVEKIALMGFSAGSALGMLLIDRYPQDYSLYIGVAQMVDGKRGELLSLQYALDQAKLHADAKAVSALQAIQFDFSKPETILTQTQKERPYLLKYGGVYRSYSSYRHETDSLWRAPQYNLFDFLCWPLGSLRSLKAMWPEVVLLNLPQEVPSVTVPVVFLSGASDYNNPTALVREYFDHLDAKRGKEFILFEHSAHGIFWDEPERFEQVVGNALKTYCK